MTEIDSYIPYMMKYAEWPHIQRFRMELICLAIGASLFRENNPYVVVEEPEFRPLDEKDIKSTTD